MEVEETTESNKEEVVVEINSSPTEVVETTKSDKEVVEVMIL